jgi:hypothetical protein
MELRKKSRDTVESLTESIDFLRRIILLIFIILQSAIIGILNYRYLGFVVELKQVFEMPSQFVSKLSILGFCLSGVLIGFGNKLCGGGIFVHGLCGIPSFSGRSLTIVLIIFGFAAAADQIKTRFLSGLMHTEILYNSELDRSYFLSFGLISCCVCFLVCAGFGYVIKLKKLQLLMKIKRGMVFLIKFN